MSTKFWFIFGFLAVLGVLGAREASTFVRLPGPLKEWESKLVTAMVLIMTVAFRFIATVAIVMMALAAYVTLASHPFIRGWLILDVAALAAFYLICRGDNPICEVCGDNLYPPHQHITRYDVWFVNPQAH